MGVTAGSIQWHPDRIKKEIKQQLRRYRISRGLTRDTGFWDMAHEDVLNLGSLDAYCERGDHFHGVVSGFLKNAKEYAKATGCGYKKGRYMTNEVDIRRYAYYVATHSAYEWGKQSVRYVGNMHSSKMGRTLVDKRIEDVCCEVCKARMQEMYLDPDGVVVGLSRDHVTRMVRIYEYWMRGDKSHRLRKSRASLIWGEDGPPGCRGDPS